MPTYRKRPVKVEAYRWFPELPEGAAPGVCHCSKKLLLPDGSGILGMPHIHTLEGAHLVSPGDWVLTGVQGEQYPCKDAIFRQTYEPAEPAAVALLSYRFADEDEQS